MVLVYLRVNGKNNFVDVLKIILIYGLLKNFNYI